MLVHVVQVRPLFAEHVAEASEQTSRYVLGTARGYKRYSESCKIENHAALAAGELPMHIQ